ncbi:MAG: tRNA (adenosine(37)-N6)-threonylcarbamoyltransferase complex ATPase subunit type 1 TsaE [Tissierellia bacterium]|jgi:tRNA threonylcarbamoyladenosine biosynthesis protein TsaE|nr:tRNA (adenosine(37)-N6)-threonylcarbamoyltransferase complex ATPase subunit type 1 TsaE [Tissierellia bacterium]
MKKILINSIDEMKRLGNLVGKTLKGGETICLRGDLGAGKTHLTQFIGEGMGIDDYITSPTFALLNIYDGEINLNHFDTYRLEGEEDFLRLGFEDYLFSDDVNIIEWPDIIYEILPKDTLDIDIKKGEDETRIISINTNNEKKYKYILESIENESFGD